MTSNPDIGTTGCNKSKFTATKSILTYNSRFNRCINLTNITPINQYFFGTCNTCLFFSRNSQYSSFNRYFDDIMQIFVSFQNYTVRIAWD